MKELLYKSITKELMDRKDKGFSVLLVSWLRWPLREWASDLLAEWRLLAGGYFETDQVRKVWHDHLEGKGDYSRELWCILMFQAWLHND